MHACLHLLICRKGDGDNSAVGKPQQLYKPVDLRGVQRPSTSASGAMLSRDPAGALSDGQVVKHVQSTSASIHFTP